MPEPQPPRLPNSAPPSLKDFVACRRDDVLLDPSDTGWIPTPAFVPDAAAPLVEVTPGPTPDSAAVAVGWGFVAITLPVSVSDGHLRVDTSRLSSFGDLVEPITRWVDQLNAVLDAHGKRLHGLRVSDGRISLRKQPVAVVAQPPSAAAPTPTPPPEEVGPSPAPVPPTPPTSRPGCLLFAAVAAVVLGLVATGAFFLVRGDDSTTSDTAPIGFGSTGPSTPVSTVSTVAPAATRAATTLATTTTVTATTSTVAAETTTTAAAVTTTTLSPAQQRAAEDRAAAAVLEALPSVPPFEAGTLTESGAVAESTPGTSAFDATVGVFRLRRAATSSTPGPVYVYVETDVPLLQAVAMEFDAYASDRRTVVADTSFVGRDGPFPPWSVVTENGTVIGLDGNPIPVSSGRVGAVFTTDIEADTFAFLSVWIYGRLTAGRYVFTHFVVQPAQIVTLDSPLPGSGRLVPDPPVAHVGYITEF